MPSTVMLCWTLNKDIWSVQLLLRVSDRLRLSFPPPCLWGPPWAPIPTPEECNTLLVTPPHRNRPFGGRRWCSERSVSCPRSHTPEPPLPPRPGSESTCHGASRRPWKKRLLVRSHCVPACLCRAALPLKSYHLMWARALGMPELREAWMAGEPRPARGRWLHGDHLGLGHARLRAQEGWVVGRDGAARTVT